MSISASSGLMPASVPIPSGDSSPRPTWRARPTTVCHEATAFGEGGSWGEPAVPPMRASSGVARRATSSPSRREPPALLLVAEDDDVLAALEHDLEVAAADRLFGPPPVEHPPLLANCRHRLAVHPVRRPVEAFLD